LFAGIVTVSVGHCHPKVNAALKEQLDTLWHTTNIYLHPKVIECKQQSIITRSMSRDAFRYTSTPNG
jgi:acetylornithine/succinyldiaminopimelate/putrescine aminotransferase